MLDDSSSKPGPPDIEPPFCDLCKTRMDSAEEFKEHLRTKHNIPA